MNTAQTGYLKQNRTEVHIFLIIFLCFLFTGSAYISWLYKLTDFYEYFQADILSEGVGYLIQALGLFLFALVVKYRPKIAADRRFLQVVLLLDGLAITIIMLANTKEAVLITGLIMNLFHGMAAGVYLTKLALHVPQQKKCTVFGLGYGLGSIATWLLSLPMNHRFLRSDYCLAVYLVLIILITVINYSGRQETLQDNVNSSPVFKRPQFALIAAVIILLSVVKGLGFYFPMSQSISGTINLEFSRAFYAAGLVFPFISFVLKDVPAAASALWILGYVFFGFFAVYRVTVFCDVAAKNRSLIWTAGFGLLFGRIGDALGTMIGTLFEQNYITLVIAAAVLFIITVILFFNLYHILYIPVLSQEQNEEKLLTSFELQYGLSARECEVFRLAIKGRSNGEIAGDLYISESTVKFHMKNVLKKTGCANRTELAVKFKINPYLQT